MKLRVKEHQVEVKRCLYCGHRSQGSFPAEASNVVQYGPRLKAMMVYLMEAQLLPSKGSCEVLSDLLGVKVSEGRCTRPGLVLRASRANRRAYSRNRWERRSGAL
jgi:transposase